MTRKDESSEPVAPLRVLDDNNAFTKSEVAALKKVAQASIVLRWILIFVAGVLSLPLLDRFITNFMEAKWHG